jgi:hypothetical protein
VQKVNAVTTTEVQHMAEDHPDPAKMAIVVVGDKAKIPDQRAHFAAGTKPVARLRPQKGVLHGFSAFDPGREEKCIFGLRSLSRSR